MNPLNVASWWMRNRPIRAIRTARKSSTVSAVALPVAGAGVAAIIDPTLLEMIPEDFRGYVITAVAVVIILARLRRELFGHEDTAVDAVSAEE